jgi:hypothetical protein
LPLGNLERCKNLFKIFFDSQKITTTEPTENTEMGLYLHLTDTIY